MPLMPVSDEEFAMARRHENRCRGYEREARAAAALLVASPQPVLSLEAAPVFQSIWLTDGRPPALLTFYRNLGKLCSPQLGEDKDIRGH